MSCGTSQTRLWIYLPSQQCKFGAILSRYWPVNNSDLRQNALRRITRSTFTSLEHIDSIDLRGNPLTEIDFEALDDRALRALKIDSQDFLCDCNLIWFSSIINKINPASLENNKCHYPPNLRGQKLSEIATEDLTCDKNPKPILIKGNSLLNGNDCKLYF